MPVELTNDNFATEIEAATVPVVIDVYAVWCGPCQQMAPLFDELAQELQGQVKFAKLNVDHVRDLAIKWGVSSVPTFIFYQAGQIVGRATGYMNKRELQAKMAAVFKT